MSIPFAGIYCTLRRYPLTGSYDSNGEWAQATPNETGFPSTEPQPLRGSDLLVLPEGERADRWRTIYTEWPLYVSDQETAQQSDRVVYGSAVYKVMHIEQQTQVIPHYQVWLAQLDEATT